MSASTDRIERQVLIDAPRSRVWRALADAEEFGKWFGVALQGQRFVAGERTRGPTTSAGHEHVLFDVVVEQVEPERLLSFRWHPHAVDPATDYATEQTTLVVFELQDAGTGTLLKVVESGFDQLPPPRRAQALRMNTGGWDTQMASVQQHVAPN